MMLTRLQAIVERDAAVQFHQCYVVVIICLEWNTRYDSISRVDDDFVDTEYLLRRLVCFIRSAGDMRTQFYRILVHTFAGWVYLERSGCNRQHILPTISAHV
jgi:hypothetical protein